MKLAVREDWLEFAYFTAGQNWVAWRSFFEEKAQSAAFMIIDSEKLYRIFIKDYNLLRGLSKDHRSSLYSFLKDNITSVHFMRDHDGSSVMELSEKMTEENLPRQETSLLSKLAAFSNPEYLMASDRFSRKGISLLTGNDELARHEYVTYIEQVNKLSVSELGEKISNYCSSRTRPTERAAAFERRVLDVYLMIAGERWKEYFPEK